MVLLNTDILAEKKIIEDRYQEASKQKQGLQKNINIMDKNINGSTTARKKATHENNVIEGNLLEYEN
jgi:hypothetical protein